MRHLLNFLCLAHIAFACTVLRDAPGVHMISQMQAHLAILTDSPGLGVNAQLYQAERQASPMQQLDELERLQQGLQEIQFKEEIMNRIEDAHQAELDQEAQVLQQQFKAEIEGRKFDIGQLKDPLKGSQEEQEQVAASRRLLIDSGKPATTAMYPYLAMVTRPDTGKYLCGGTLVHPRVVLTAAHCVIKELDGSVDPGVDIRRDGRAQRSGFQSIRTRSIPHPKFQPGSFDYDVAALILEEPAKTDPVTLVAKGETLGKKSQRSSDSKLITLGWGATERNELAQWLLFAEVSPVDHGDCQELFKQFGSEVTERMTCVTGRTCAGDSGGPLFLLPNGKPPGSSSIKAPVLQSRISPIGLPGASNVDPAEDAILVGQVSFGFPRGDGMGCPEPNPATVFTDLASPELQEWLLEEIIGIALKEGPERATQNKHDWSDTSLPPAFQHQINSGGFGAGGDETAIGDFVKGRQPGEGLWDVLWDVGPYRRRVFPG